MRHSCLQTYREILFACFCVGDGLVYDLEELAAVADFDEGRASGGAGYDPDSGGVVDADPLAESLVGIDLRNKRALRVYGERHGDLVIGREFLCELAQDFQRGDGRLICEDGVAIVISELVLTWRRSQPARRSAILSQRKTFCFPNSWIKFDSKWIRRWDLPWMALFTHCP